MGRYDSHTWVDRENLSAIRDIKFSKEFLIKFYKLILKMEKTEEDI